MRIKEIMALSVVSLATTSMLYANDNVNQMDSVTVTANKIEENIQDIPQSITVIDETIIEEKGIKTVTDIVNIIPNMYASPNHGTSVNFRGLNTSMFTNNNPVVIYIDGIPTSDRYSFDASMENVERIEVLRGPQGTLYGKDAIGAVINIVTKKPDNEVSGSVGVEYGNNNYKRGNFNITAPVIDDKLYFNLNGDVSSTDDDLTNSYNKDDKASREHDKKYSTSLFYKATDNLSAKLVLKREVRKDYYPYGQGKSGATSLDEFSKDAEVSFDMPTVEEQTILSKSLSLEYEADKYTINSVTTQKKTDFDGTYDADFMSGTAYDGTSQSNYTDTKTFTQELRLSNKADKDIRWVSGVYYDKDNRKQGPYGTPGLNVDSDTDSETKAVFGQTMIPLNDKSELTLGGRYQKIKKEIDLTASGFYNYTLTDHKKDWSVFLPKVALSYKVSENITPYVSFSKGYMPGGFNYFAISGTADENSFDPQRSTNYEVGLKGFIDNFSFSAAAFKMDIKDIHVYRANGSIYYTENAEKAHSKGIEFDFNYFPSDSFEISGALGLISTKYDSYKVGSYDFSGNKIDSTPSHTFNLGLAYYHPQGFYARTDIKNEGDIYFYDDRQKTFLKENGHTVVDLKGGYRFSDWDVYAYGKNVTDEEYISHYMSNSTVSLASFGDSRTYGVGAKYKF